jgi:hypothetical protein
MMVTIRRPAGQKNGETRAKMWNLFATGGDSMAAAPERWVDTVHNK